MHKNVSLQNTQVSADTEKSNLLFVQQTLKRDLHVGQLQHLPIQRKLPVGADNDPMEHEADAMADKVMRMPEQNFIQRKCAHCEEEEKQLQRKPLASFIQKKQASPGNNVVASDSVSHQIDSTKGSGNAMEAPTKSFMESRFGTDFSNVNIHTGNDASQLSKDLNAQAFTVGNDIYFNEGKYAPESSEGKHLLAHELTHTIQQSEKNKNATSTNYNAPGIQRFTDDAHHIIDEAGLTGGGFTEDQVKEIEIGNKLRDYSQLPSIGNAILLCQSGQIWWL